MIISNVTRSDCEAALASVNARFAGNIRFKDGPRLVGHTRNKTEKWSLTLTVNETRLPRQLGQKRGAPASGVSVSYQKLIAAACWHVHGYFMDALPPSALIRIGSETTPHHPGDAWQDFEKGSLAQPLYASEACNCEGNWDEK